MNNKRIAIVTGASSGFGLLTCMELAKNGFYVVATMRNLEKKARLIEQAKKVGVWELVEIFPLDVTEERSVATFRRKVEELGRVDVLVNNAGFAGAGFSEEIPVHEYRKQFETNVFGAIAVTGVCLPFMRLQRKGRIINISSISGRVGFPGLSPYVASKHALEGWSESLRLEVKLFGIDVVLVEPGSFHTSIWSTGKFITKKSLEDGSPYASMMEKLTKYLEKGERGYEDPLKVARLIATIALKSKPKLRYTVGKGVRLTLFVKSLLPWRLWELIVLKKLK